MERLDTLKNACKDVFIIAHSEDTTKLRTFLNDEKFRVQEIRGPYQPYMADWSPNVLCMVNHMNAWRQAASKKTRSIIVEADFVPVDRFGSLPVPFDIRTNVDSMCYLYACGPQLWDLQGGMRGHASAMAAYIVTPNVARLLEEYANTEVLSGDPEKYAGWDSGVGFWLNKRGVQCFLTYRNYGEHGGVPNPEHRIAGLRAQHRADVLQGALSFLPLYAQESRVKYYWIRLRARLWGLARTLTGRYLAIHDLMRSDRKMFLLRIALGRQVLRRPPF